MRRRPAIAGLAAAALLALLACGVLPGAAHAKLSEMGAIEPGASGSCPAAGATLATVPAGETCQALTRLTAYQAKVGPDRELYRAPEDGRIVAWTLALGKPTASQTKYFFERYGGNPQAAVVVLDPGKKLSRQVVAKAPVRTLTGFLGQIVQFPLEQSLAIKKGQYVGLTVPTWAPAMQLGRLADTSWRSSRDVSGCFDYTTQFGLLGKRTSALFRCLYKGVRLTYSATFIGNPRPAETK
jgi:hypothetical protein